MGHLMRAGLAAALVMAIGPALAAEGLKTGEYACYGSGGRPLIGLGFKVQAGNRYTDLDGKSPGTYAVGNGAIAFKGGHLDGQTGRNLKGNTFQLGAMVSCEPY